MGRRVILTLILACVFVPAASAQWADPGGTWDGLAVVADAPTATVAPAEVLPAVEPDETANVETVDPRSLFPVAPPSFPVLPATPPRVVTPANPYETLPPGAIPPARPPVPPNPYEGLPPGVTVPRPPVPCGGARACS